MGRLRKSVNYGTNGGVAITSKASDFDPTQAGVQAYASGGPTACNSTAYSVTETQYDWLGRPVLATDNAGRVTKTVYDAAGRTARVIANYVAWEGETDTNLPPQRSGDINVITEYGYYDSDGRLWTQTAADPDGDGSVADNQVTTYAYVSPGTCPSAAGEDLLSSVTYPDGGVVGYTYYADGSMATMTDQNGTVHTYTRDRLGRVTADIVTLATGSAVDNSVLRTTTSYDNQGRVSQVDTYATTSGGAPTSEVAYDYAPSGGVKTSWQSHSGAADTTSTSTTPRVQYFYGRSADGSTVRLTRIVYPNGRVVQFNYGLAGSDPDGPFGRFGSISDPAGNVYASYTYMGVDSAIRVDHPGVSGDLVLNYDPLGNHSCSGLDSLGRIVQQSWTIDGTQVDGYAYGYDGSGNRTYKQNLTATGLDELYSYDSLGRLTNASRGTLNEGHTAITSASLEQGWTLDGVGNWSNYTSDDGTTSVDQDRDVTEANEISSITTNNSTAAWLTPTYDADGNMISAPKARAESDASQRQLYIYDAWNRLVKLAVDDNGNSTTETTDANGVYDAGSDLVIAQYFYDGLGRRIAKSVAVYGTGSNSSTISNWRRTDYYYDESWQVLEERTALVAANSPTAVVTLSTSGVTVTQYVWDALYVDTPIVRDMDVNGDGDCIDTGDQHLCYLTDANHNVTGLVSLSGHVVERYCYSSYGALAIFDGQTDLAGNTTTDWTARTGSAATISAAGNTILYASMAMDSESGLYITDYNYYLPSLGVWIGRDRAEATSNLYAYCRGNPGRYTDPKGLDIITSAPTSRRSQLYGDDGPIPGPEDNAYVAPSNIPKYNDEESQRAAARSEYYGLLAAISIGIAYSSLDDAGLLITAEDRWNAECGTLALQDDYLRRLPNQIKIERSLGESIARALPVSGHYMTMVDECLEAESYRSWVGNEGEENPGDKMRIRAVLGCSFGIALDVLTMVPLGAVEGVMARFAGFERAALTAETRFMLASDMVVGEGFDTIAAGSRLAIRTDAWGYSRFASEGTGIIDVTSEVRIRYGSLDSLGRPTGVNAVITREMIGTGTPACSDIIPPGWSGNGILYNEGRGHLLGAQLGGSGDIAENLVTLQQVPANSPVMRSFEASVRGAVANGEIVTYSAIPIYDGFNLVPRGITLSGRGSGGFTLNVTVLNPVKR